MNEEVVESTSGRLGQLSSPSMDSKQSTTPKRRRALPSAPGSGGRRSGPPSANQSPEHRKPSGDVLFQIDADTSGALLSPTSLPRKSLMSPDTRPDSQLGSRAPSGASSAAVSPEKASAMNSPLREADQAMENQNVVVAVRVRPSSEREITAGGQSCIEMVGNETTIRGETKEHSFIYDHSFQSYDKNSKAFADQRKIFEKLGVPLLNRAMEGYNCCLFAYGQTGSGKSYSMMGEQKSRGIIPRFAEAMWRDIKSKPDVQFKVEISYFEIYAEQIFDLLVPPKNGMEKNRLKVREHPIMGPYVDNLTVYPALNFEDIEGYITLGGKYRATASTNMNATSSRSHAVFTVTITQVETEEGEEHTKVSKVNLIDLAGSERSDRAGTSGQRLREGSAINKSLHTLGKIISTLAANGLASKKRKAFVPYRDSVLTWILKESLGGNAKTAMLATLSPCFENYQETLSTLRYAQQARSIVNDAKINEDENIALIRELRLEIERLRGQYGDAKGHVAMAEVESLREKLASSERLMSDINRSWEEKLRQSEKVRLENQRALEAQSQNYQDLLKIDNRQPNLVNLNEDPQLSEMLVYIIKEGDTTIGKKSSNDVVLKGVFVRNQHAKLHFDKETGVSLTVISDSLMYVNGEIVPNGETVQLKHGDRIIFGNHHFFRLNIPKDSPAGQASSSFDGEIKDYRFAQEELERVQTERIEAQLQDEHHKQKQKILQQLEDAEQLAQRKLESQRQEFENKLRVLESEQAQIAGERNLMVEQAVVSAQAAERERAMAEIAQQREKLERERDEMEERMRDEKERARRQMEEEAAAKNKIIDELELEKSKIEQDLDSLKKSHERRRQSNAHALLRDKFGTPHAEKKHDWIHISARINEANELSNRLQQNTVFNRADNCMEGGEASIQLHNTKLGIATTWSLAKFEDRLVQINEAYHKIEGGADTSIADDLFYDPDDEWVLEDLASMNKPKWLRSQPRSRSLYEINPSGQFLGMLGSIKAEAKAHRQSSGGYNSPSTLDKLTGGKRSQAQQQEQANPYSDIPSVPVLCRQYVKNSLDSLLGSQNSIARTSADDVVEAASALRRAVDVLCNESAASKIESQHDVPLNELGNVRNASLSAAISTELLCNTIRAVMHGPDGKFIGHISSSLSDAATNVATSMGKLLQGIENNIESMVIDSRDEIIKGISSMSMAAGELAIATFKGEDDDVDEELDTEGIGDPGEFALEEEESSYASTSRMVIISPKKGEQAPIEEPFKIDDEILAAFDKGARMHVDKSMTNLTEDMEECASSIADLIRVLNAKSNVSAAVVQAVVEVIKTTRETFVAAQGLQKALAESDDVSARAKMTFYRKSFSRAKGIINEIREVADAINGLVAGCKGAVNGSDGVEQVMSHAKTLRAALARLTSGADTKLVGAHATADHRALSAKLRNACNAVTLSSKQLTAECEEYSSSDSARIKRQSTPARGGSISRGRAGSTIRGSIRKLSSGIGPMSEVKRRALLVEQESEVYRLEAELRDAQASVKELRKKAYGGFAPPMAELDGASNL